MNLRLAKAIEDGWTISRIMAKYRVRPGNIWAVAMEKNLEIKRPRDWEL